MSNYSELLKDPRWQKKRLQIMDRDGWKCSLCENEDMTLNVHHLKYSGKPWEADDSHLITLCEKCHKMEEGYKQENPFLKDLSDRTGILATILVDASIAGAYRIKSKVSTHADLKKFIGDNYKEIEKMITNG